MTTVYRVNVMVGRTWKPIKGSPRTCKTVAAARRLIAKLQKASARPMKFRVLRVVTSVVNQCEIR